jgi:hypothetical protein
MQNEFLGGDEVCRMENGARYGLSRVQYWRLASCAVACEKYASIQPNTISPLPDHDEPGCVVELFGKRCLFSITVRPAVNLITLSVWPLDTAQEKGVEAFSGTDSQDDFKRMTNIILQTDGLVGWRFMTYEETLTFMRDQGIDC